MKAIKTLSTLKKVTGQVVAETDMPLTDKVRLIGSLFVVLSGCILYTDKIVFFDISPYMPDKFLDNGLDPYFFIWLVAQTVSPILLIIGGCLRAFVVSYAVPLVCYVLQFYFILIDYSLVDSNYKYLYAFGISIAVLAFLFWMRNLAQIRIKFMIKEAKSLIKEKEKQIGR